MGPECCSFFPVKISFCFQVERCRTQTFSWKINGDQMNAPDGSANQKRVFQGSKKGLGTFKEKQNESLNLQLWVYYCLGRPISMSCNLSCHSPGSKEMENGKEGAGRMDTEWWQW